MPALQVIALDTTTPQLRAPASGDTYSAPRALDITPETLTGSSATSSLSIAQTWNTSGTPTAIDLNVTDTASNAASRLLRITSGGIVRLQLRKDGLLQGAGPSSGAFIIGSTTEFRPGAVNIGAAIGSFSTGSTAGGGSLASDSAGASAVVGWSNRGFALSAASVLGWTSNTLSNAADLELHRDAANTLAQRNGVNAQAFNIYNTYTDASNYERLGIFWSSNTLTIAPQAAGTGGLRSMNLQRVSLVNNHQSRFYLDGDNAVFGNFNSRISMAASGGAAAGAGDIHFVREGSGLLSLRGGANATAGAALNFLEQTAPAAPAADQVRIYAEDNGAGKTRLMALFATGAAQQIAIEP